jgi:hypothetical protein
MNVSQNQPIQPSDIYEGRCILLPIPDQTDSNTGRKVLHLWMVLTNWSGNPQQFLAVNLTKKRRNSDTTIILQPGAHPFVKSETIVAYFGATLFTLKEINNQVKKYPNDWRFHRDNCNAVLLRRIQAGLVISKFTPNEVKAFYIAYQQP